MTDLDPQPIPMRLPCPSCGVMHVDEGEYATKPHHTHACQSCGEVWRPTIATTVGVRFLPGFKNDDEGTPTDMEPLGPAVCRYHGGADYCDRSATRIPVYVSRAAMLRVGHARERPSRA